MKHVHVILCNARGQSNEVYTISICSCGSLQCFVLIDTEFGVCDGGLSLSICRAVVLDQK